MTHADVETSPSPEGPKSFLARCIAEVKSRPKPYALLAAFIAAGPILTSYLFPEAPLGVHIVGGIAFGIYAGVSAIPQKFF